MSNLLPGERIDELQRNDYKIIQNPQKFCFGMDAVLLSGFARVKAGESCLDLGCGNGIIPLLLSAKTQGRHFTGLEIQPYSADLARRSVALNHLEERVRIVEGDIKDASSIFGASSFHVVTTNPPYMTAQHGIPNPDEAKMIARHEILCTLEDVIRENDFIWYTDLFGWRRLFPSWYIIRLNRNGCGWCTLMWIGNPIWCFWRDCGAAGRG